MKGTTDEDFPRIPHVGWQRRGQHKRRPETEVELVALRHQLLRPQADNKIQWLDIYNVKEFLTLLDICNVKTFVTLRNFYNDFYRLFEILFCWF